MDENYFSVKYPIIPNGRLIGVSGILRVRNDSEFIESSIDSCIDALDELIIVYNDCTDNSPELIEKKRKQYPDKIKVYEYKPNIVAFNLSNEEYSEALLLPDDSIHLLSNYYNFALQKISYKYFMKIDADQLYFSEKLKEVCDAYRFNGTEVNILFHEYLFAYLFAALFKICDKAHYDFPMHIFKKWSEKYYYVLLKFIQKRHVSVSLSGVNVSYCHDTWCVSLGKSGNFNTLPPYNGVGDHLIVELKNEVFYRPYVCSEYNKMISQKYSIIERLYGAHNVFPLGFMWFHLNANRKSIFKRMTESAVIGSTLLPVVDFLKLKPSELENEDWRTIMSRRGIIYTKLLHRFFSNSVDEKYIHDYHIDVDGVLRKR